MNKQERQRLCNKLARVRFELQHDLARLSRDHRILPAERLAATCDRLQDTIEALHHDIATWM